MWLLLRPLFYVWAALNVIDSLGFGTRVARLAVGTLRARFGNANDDTSLCQVCDDVMGDLLAGNDGLSAIPCRAACLRVPQCVQMCETVQQASESSLEFPCVAAGFCPHHDQDSDNALSDEQLQDLITACRAAKWNPLACHPRRYCHRVRRGLQWTCQLRPGRKRWTHMKTLAQQHTVALAQGLLAQKHCSDPNAGPYCIARPQGWSIVADILGHVLSLGLGGVQSIRAVQSPGGDDDRQWLIYWLVLAMVLFVEHNFARVLLSSCPLYYEGKLVALLWLLWWGGSEVCYRWLKRFLQDHRWILASNGVAQRELQRIKDMLGPEVLREKDQIMQQVTTTSASPVETVTTLPSMNGINNDTTTNNTNNIWQFDPDADTSDELQAMKELFELSVFLLSAQGATLLSESAPQRISKNTVSLVLERAAAWASFQPRYLYVTLIGTTASDPVPAMDANGLADPYVLCRLVPPPDSGLAPYPASGITSTTRYKTRYPQWAGERLEIPLRGGGHDASGYYVSHNEVVGRTLLHVAVRDADVGVWSVLYQIFQIVAPLSGLLWWILPKLPAKMIPSLQSHTRSKQMVMMIISTKAQQTWLWWMMVLCCLGYVISYVKAVVHRSDDDCVGECRVPLSILMDQGEHALSLTLRRPSDQAKEQEERAKVADHHRGVLRIRLSLSEN